MSLKEKTQILHKFLDEVNQKIKNYEKEFSQLPFSASVPFAAFADDGILKWDRESKRIMVISYLEDISLRLIETKSETRAACLEPLKALQEEIENQLDFFIEKIKGNKL